MTGADKESNDPRETGTQLSPGLWHTINERYPGSMIEKSDFVPLAGSRKPLSETRLALISSCGVHSKSDSALDVCHPFGDFRFRRVPSAARHEDLIIHQLKYPHDDADLDINVIFPIERLQELVAEGVLYGLTKNFFSFIGYNMSTERFEARSHTGSPTRLRWKRQPMSPCWSPLDRSAISPSD